MKHFTVRRLVPHKLNYKNLINALNGKIVISDDLKDALRESINQNDLHEGPKIVKMGLVEVIKTLSEDKFAEYFQKEVLEDQGLLSVSLAELLLYKTPLWQRKIKIGTLGWFKKTNGHYLYPQVESGLILPKKVTLYDPFVFTRGGVSLCVKENK